MRATTGFMLVIGVLSCGGETTSQSSSGPDLVPDALPDADDRGAVSGSGGGPSPCAVNADCIASQSPCAVEVCVDGFCSAEEGAAGTPCDDGDPCTGPDACVAWHCTGAANLCPCAADADCVPLGPGNPCNGLFACLAEGCRLRPPPWGPDILCPDGCPEYDTPVPVCNPVTLACGPETSLATGKCDDSNPCTYSDRCVANACVGEAVHCVDGSECTADVCQAGTCVASMASDVCADGASCDETLGCLAALPACPAGQVPRGDGVCTVSGETEIEGTHASALVALADGFALVYAEAPEGCETALRAQRFDVAGALKGAPVTIADAVSSSCGLGDATAVAGLDGELAVVFRMGGGGALHFAIAGAGPAVPLGINTLSGLRLLSGYRLLYHSKAPAGMVLRPLDASGTVQGEPVVLGPGEAVPGLAVLPDGSLLTAWRVETSVTVRRFDPGGVEIGDPAYVPGAVISDADPTLALFDDGGALVAWRGPTGLGVARIAPDGSPGAAVAIPDLVTMQHMTAVGAGGHVVVLAPIVTMPSVDAMAAIAFGPSLAAGPAVALNSDAPVVVAWHTLIGASISGGRFVAAWPVGPSLRVRVRDAPVSE